MSSVVKDAKFSSSSRFLHGLNDHILWNLSSFHCDPLTQVCEVSEILKTDPIVSARRNPSGLPMTCFNDITRLDLRWHLCMIQVNHQLLPGDFQRLIDFCSWFLERPEEFLRFHAIRGEAAFQMNGTVTPRNVRCYALKHHSPLEHAFSRSMSREKHSVWIGLCGNKELLAILFRRQSKWLCLSLHA